MRKPVRFGLIGAGGIGRAHAEALATSPLTELTAIVDARADTSSAVAKQFGGTPYVSLEQMLDREKLDAVVIATPPNGHAEIAIECLGRGLHLLCEKPLSLDIDTALDMLRAAKDSNAVFTMASKFRYTPDVTQAKAMVQSGMIGDIVSVENVFTSVVDMKGRWNSDPAIAGGGVLIDNGTHSVDVMRYFLGSLAWVQAIEGRRLQELEVEDTVRVFTKSYDDVMGSIDLSWSIQKPIDSYIDIIGSEGTISVGWKGSRYRLRSNNEWVLFGVGFQKIDALRKQAENFARAIGGEEDLLINADDALASVSVIAAAYASLRASRWIAVDSPVPFGGMKQTDALVAALR